MTPPAPETTVQEGESLGGYVIEGIAGRGGMGVVYRAYDRELDRHVALKVIDAAVARDHAFRRRFEREWRLAASLEHPHVLPVYRAGEEAGMLFLAMRFVEGRSLDALLAADGPLPPRDAAQIVEQIAGAVDAAHARGLVHRDVKPGNILLEAASGRAYLADFGVTLSQDAETRITRQGQFMGTPAYAAPEQIRGGRIDARTDVYSLGAVLHECLTGDVPFPAEHALDALSAHLSRPPPRPSRLRAGIPPALDQVIERAMAKDPDARFPSAGALAKAALAAVSDRRMGAAQRGLKRSVRSRTKPPTNLQLQPTPLIGRQRELAELRALLSREYPRLISLTGPGGTGKTRLALQLAADSLGDFPDGVFLVRLAALSDPDLVVPATAQALGLREAPGRPLSQGLAEHLRERRLLLVLDNFEHLMAAAPVVGDLLGAASSLRVVVTSRAPLRLEAEQEFPVPTLELPDRRVHTDLTALEGCEAVALFVARAQAVRHDFALTAGNASSVAEICARVDGLPLAIELAAARVRVLPPKSLLPRLDRRLKLLTGGSQERAPHQRTLRATLDWSYELLSPAQRELFARLAVFAGGFTIGDAEAICNPADDVDLDVLDGLTSLVEKSLLREYRTAEDEPRFRMLQTVREYAAERLDADPCAPAVRREHALQFAAAADVAFQEADEVLFVRRLEASQHNLREAVSWALGAEEYDLALRLGRHLSLFYTTQGLLSEAERILDDTTRHAAGDPGLRSSSLAWRAHLHSLRGDLVAASAVLSTARGLALRSDSDRWLAEIADVEGLLAALRGDWTVAIVALRESMRLWRALGNDAEAAVMAANLANVQIDAGDPESGVALVAEELERPGLSPANRAFFLLTWARAALAQHRPREARETLHQALESLAGIEWPWALIQCLDELARAVAAESEPLVAARLWGASEALREEIGTQRSGAARIRQVSAIAAAAAESDPNAFAAAWAEGRVMPRSDALAYALSLDAAPSRAPAPRPS